jgi:hypothetical protein
MARLEEQDEEKWRNFQAESVQYAFLPIYYEAFKYCAINNERHY